MPILLNNVAATGAAQQWVGGKGFILAHGTISGATLQMQYLGIDSTTWVPVGAAITAAGGQAIDLPPGRVRMAVTGGTPANLYASLEPIGGKQ